MQIHANSNIQFWFLLTAMHDSQQITAFRLFGSQRLSNGETPVVHESWAESQEWMAQPPQPSLIQRTTKEKEVKGITLMLNQLHVTHETNIPTDLAEEATSSL